MGQQPWSAGRRGGPRACTPCVRSAGSRTVGGAPQPLPAGPWGRLPPVAGGRAALGGGPAPRTVCPRAPAFLPASAPAPLSALPPRLVCPVLGGGSQAGRADPLASPWLPRKCSWWPFQEPTSADPWREWPGAGGPGGWLCLPLPGALVPTLPSHPPHTGVQGLTRCTAELGPTVHSGLQASVSLP